MNEQTQTIVVTLVMGLIAGWLASFITGGGNPVTYIVSGVLGALVGGYLLRMFGVNLGIKNRLLSEILTAAIGAVVVVFIARLIT